jgi:hypothetical protein
MRFAARRATSHYNSRTESYEVESDFSWRRKRRCYFARSPMQNWWERIVFSAPVFAPLLFANVAIVAWIGLATLSQGAD